MAYDSELAARVRQALHDRISEEKEMFGGLCFMVNHKMCAGIIKDELMLRVNPDRQAILLEKTGCRPMDFTHRPMKGFLMVNGDGMRNSRELKSWLQEALDYNEIAKASRKKPRKSAR